MKKLKYFIATIVLLVCLSCTAYAVTPTYKPPKLPDMSDVKIEVSVPKLKFPPGYFDYLFKDIKIPADKLPTIPNITVKAPSIKFSDDYFNKIVGNVKIPADKLPTT